MKIGALLGIAVIGCFAAWLMTAGVRRYALASQLLDHPNARSSHTTPTPRGGGIAVVVAFLVAITGMSVAGYAQMELCVALLGAGVLVATLGFIDDHASLAARWRFLGHAVAAAWVLWWMGPLPPVPLFGITVALGAGGTLLAALYMVWSINLFNFMDGIDSIASVEALTVALCGALISGLTGASEWSIAVVFAFCVVGFLMWNLPPARIFMGDVGSGFLGLVIATLSLWCGHESPQLFWSWFILGGCFMVDATTTLVRRVRRGEKFHEAHRSHAYQYASRVHRSHGRVAVAVAAINLLWLLPVALAVSSGKLDGLTGVAIAYAPLIWLAFHYKAGARVDQEV